MTIHRRQLRSSNSRRLTALLKFRKRKLAHYLSLGLTLTESVLLAKITRSQLGRLRSDPDFEDFIQKCRVVNKASYVNTIREASDLGVWQAASWYLERKYPEEFSKKSTVHHKVQVQMLAFQKIVLDVVNKVSPAIKNEILHKLRDIDQNSLTAIENEIDSIMSSDMSQQSLRTIEHDPLGERND